MPYRLKFGEPVPEGIRRIAAEEMLSAAERLGHATVKTRDEAIHEARKSVKKTRALLRLMRPELAKIHPAENARLRQIGQRLSEYRDAAVIVETFDALKEKYKDELKGATLASIRRGPLRDRREQRLGPRLRQVLARMAAACRSAAARPARWPLHADGFDAVKPGLTAAYRRSRKAMWRARAHDRPDLAHEWRKRAKDHWYHVRLLEDVWTEVMQGYEKSLKDLETWLGNHHNLQVLKEKLEARPEAYGTPGDIEICLGLIGKYQEELRRNALSLGERIYEERPGQYRTAMRNLWESWQSEPRSLREIEKERRKTAQP
jgi:CHAD domain-containing protein